jgi:hypothetical protein
MKALKRQSLGSAMLAAWVALAAVQGCGDDSGDNPTPPDITSGGTSPKAGSSNKAGSDSKGGETGEGGTGNDPSKGGETSEGGNVNVGGEGPIPQPACDLPETGADGCFNCPSNGESEEWLNRCADSDCEPFDNEARLPKLNQDGSLPELPN